MGIILGKKTFRLLLCSLVIINLDNNERKNPHGLFCSCSGAFFFLSPRHVTSADLQMFKFTFSSTLVELEIFIVSACCQCNCRLICLVRPEPLSHRTQKQKKQKYYSTPHFASYRRAHHLQMLTKDYWQGTQWTGMDWIKRDLQKAYSDGYLQKRFLFSRISYFVFPFSEVFIHFLPAAVSSSSLSFTALVWQQSPSHTQV